jgi:hypothetical protein
VLAWTRKVEKSMCGGVKLSSERDKGGRESQSDYDLMMNKTARFNDLDGEYLNRDKLLRCRPGS